MFTFIEPLKKILSVVIRTVDNLREENRINDEREGRNQPSEPSSKTSNYSKGEIEETYKVKICEKLGPVVDISKLGQGSSGEVFKVCFIDH